jgi:L-ribulokinase
MAEKSYVIGVDFGTDSVRSLIVDAENGEEIAEAVHHYVRWKEGKYCNPAQNQFRQHPVDYIEGLEKTIKAALVETSSDVAEKIRGISIDTTGSTPVAVNKSGIPLSLTAGFEENPNAMFVLWKDHTAVKEAEEINRLARSWGGVDYTQYEGGIYSSEWFWAKILRVLRADPAVRESAYSWLEHCDWIPALLTGNDDVHTVKRSRCAAGHKAMWHEEFSGLPSEDFLVKLDPILKGIRDRLYRKTETCDMAAGTLSKEWAERLGLSESVAVGVGAFDAHLGAVGGEIKPYYLSKVMGTSTCDMLIAPMKEVEDTLVHGICGQVDGSIIPDMMGMEAGQSAFGDVYAWFKSVLMFPVTEILASSKNFDPQIRDKMIQEIDDNLIAVLTDAAEKVPIDESGIIALDWMNGRRTPDANQMLKGAITGLNLGSDAARIFRALIEATAFGAKKIVDRFLSEGIPIKGVIALGGVPKKSPFIMQVMADVLDMEILVARSEQACALGSAMAAATAAGIHPSLDAAQKAMGSGFEKTYYPDKENALKYKKLYSRYSTLGDYIEKEFSGI